MFLNSYRKDFDRVGRHGQGRSFGVSEEDKPKDEMALVESVPRS